MLLKNDAKVPLILLFSLTLLAFALTLASAVLTVAKQYVGFMLDNSTTYMCSAYLTLKLQINRVSVLNASFICICSGLLFQMLLLGQLFYLLVLFCSRGDPKYIKFTYNSLILLYVGFSLAIMGVMVSFSYFMTYLIEEGVKCLDYLFSDWLAIVVLQGIVLAMLFICWGYLLVFKKQIEESQHQPTMLQTILGQDQRKFNDESKTQNDKSIRQPLLHPLHSPTVLPSPQNQTASEKSSNKSLHHEPEYITYLYQQIKRQRVQEQKDLNSIQEPFVQQVESEDRYSEKGEKQKLTLVSYEQYMQKKYKQRDLIRIADKKDKTQHKQQAVLSVQDKRSQLDDTSLSPNNSNFNLIFQQPESSIEQHSQLYTKQVEKKEEEAEYYPANFTPANEKEWKLFLAYKKRIQNNGKKNKFKHPQNIEGGRSKRVMNQFLNRSKRPIRNQKAFWAVREEQAEKPEQQEKSDSEIEEGTESDSEEEQSQSSQNTQSLSATFVRPQTPKTINITPPPRPMNLQQVNQVQPDTLYFHKQRIPQRKKKHLFDYPHTQMPMSDVLSLLVRGIEQESLRKRVSSLRERRKTNALYRGKKGQKLIDSIRSTFY